MLNTIFLILFLSLFLAVYPSASAIDMSTKPHFMADGNLLCFSYLISEKESVALPTPPNTAYRFSEQHRLSKNWISSARPWIAPSIRDRFGDGLGYKKGYETAELFLGIYNKRYQYFPFLDLQVHHIQGTSIKIDGDSQSRGEWCGSIGIGHREFYRNRKTFGAYAFYDFRSLPIGTMEQFSFGFELLGNIVDMRTNAYIPFGKKKLLKNTTLYSYPDDFFALQYLYEEALWRFDIEGGKQLLTLRCLDIYAGLGPYFFGSPSDCCGAHLGGAGRFSLSFFNFLETDFYITFDPIYQINAQIEISLSTSLPSSLRCCKRLFKRIRRNEIIMTRKNCTYKTNF